MSLYENAIAERLHDAAGRIPVETDVSSVTAFRGATVVPRASRRRRGVLAGVAAVASAAAVAIVVWSTPGTDTVETGATSESASLLPHVASPPAWFGEPQGAYRQSGLRTGRWVSLAIARESTEGVTEPVVVSVFDGTYEPLEDAEPVPDDGTDLRLLELDDWPGWQALATIGTPTVMAAGSVDERTLERVLDAVEVLNPSGEFSLRLRDLPGSYVEIVAPRALGPDVDERRTLASESGHVGISEHSDLADPLLSAAWSGADLTRMDVGDGTGWMGETTANPHGPLRFLVWSPHPGVVFEISTDDMQLSTRDLVALAHATSAVDVDEWNAIYGD